MTDAQTILKMIEEVDPADTAKLDEIDALVWCWLNNKRFLYLGRTRWPTLQDFIGNKRDNFYVRYGESDKTSDFEYVPTYTRSRDALKAIRPDGWMFQMLLNSQSGEPSKHGDLFVYYDATREKPYQMRKSPELKSEELAELHAIISAIDYERSRK